MLNRHKIHERKKKKNCTNVNLRNFFFYRIFDHECILIQNFSTKRYLTMLSSSWNYPVNIFPLFSYKYIFFIEQVRYVHIFRIIISHSLLWIAYSNSAVQLYIITSVWYVKMEQLMVKDVAIEMVYDRYIRYSRKRRAKRTLSRWFFFIQGITQIIILQLFRNDYVNI